MVSGVGWPGSPLQYRLSVLAENELKSPISVNIRAETFLHNFYHRLHNLVYMLICIEGDVITQIC
jgi:hypothetical protein